MKNKKAFSLAEIMIAILIFFMGITGVYYLFTQGTVQLDKASFVTIATTIAKGEIDSVKTAEFYLISNEKLEIPAEWVKIEKGSQLFKMFDVPEEYHDRFEKKVVISDVIQNRLKKVVVSVRWLEVVKGKEKWRQFNYPTMIANTRVYIYFN
ncbi:MAG: prepilin-type N-terminal cleavage/methylation domain-containing protein [Candidatus Muiribacteriota bacterium]